MKLLDTVEYVPWKTLGAALVNAGPGERTISLVGTSEERVNFLLGGKD